MHEGPVTKRSDEVVQPTAGGSGGGAIKPFVILPPLLLLPLPLPLLLLEDILLIFIVADVILAPSQTLLHAELPLIDGVHDDEDNEQELERMDNDGDDIEDVDDPALVFIKAVIATFL